MTHGPVQPIFSEISGSGHRPSATETHNSHITRRTRTRSRRVRPPVRRTTLRLARGCRDGAGGLPRARISRRICAPSFHRPDRGPARRRGARPVRLRLPRRLRQPQRRQHRRRHEDRQDRRHRPAHRRPVRPRQGHPALRRARRQAGQRHQRRARAGSSRSPRSTTRPRPTSARTPPPSSPRTTRSSASSATSTRASASRPSRSSRRPTSPRSRPANTNPSLTIGADAANPKRAYKTYFRTCTTDAVQGPFAAQYLLGAGHQERRDDPRQEGLRPGSRRRVHHGVQEGRRHHRRGRDDQPRRVELPGRRVQGRPVEARRRSTTAVSTRRAVRSRSR